MTSTNVLIFAAHFWSRMQVMRQRRRRSTCPINFFVEAFGDSWSFLIIRDIVFFGKHTFGEFASSSEGLPQISSPAGSPAWSRRASWSRRPTRATGAKDLLTDGKGAGPDPDPVGDGQLERETRSGDERAAGVCGPGQRRQGEYVQADPRDGAGGRRDICRAGQRRRTASRRRVRLLTMRRRGRRRVLHSLPRRYRTSGCAGRRAGTRCTAGGQSGASHT